MIFFATAVALLLGWIVGFFFLGAGGIIHTLAVFALIFYLQSIISTPKPKTP